MISNTMDNFGIFLPAQDANALSKVKQAIDDVVAQRVAGVDLVTVAVMEAVAKVKLTVGNGDFAPAFAGSLLSKYAQTPADFESAICLLKMDQSANPFSAQLAGYLERHGSLMPTTRVFSATGPYDAWEKTGFYQAHMNGIVNNVAAFAQRTAPKTKQPVIIDVGPATGVLLARILNRLVDDHDLEAINLVLIDISTAMLEGASAYCLEHVSVPLQITTIECHIEDIKPEQLAQIESNKPIWFAHASASLHHMPHTQKQKAMETLGGLTDHLLITEFDANNDLPEANTPELFYSVVGLYGYFFDDICKSPATEVEKRASIDDFLLSEAVIIIRSEHRFGSSEELGRIDYHAHRDVWIEAAKHTGWTVYRAETSVVVPDGGRAVTFFLDIGKMPINGELYT